MRGEAEIVRSYVDALSRIESYEVARVYFLDLLVQVLLEPDANFQADFSPSWEGKYGDFFLFVVLAQMLSELLEIELGRKEKMPVDRREIDFLSWGLFAGSAQFVIAVGEGVD